MTRLLLIGSGGREHALARKLASSPKLTQLFIAPGNPGTAQYGKNVPISESDIPALLAFAKSESIDITLVGPEGPLVAGIVDRFESQGLKIVGPSQAGAQLEGSKNWSKAFMIRHGIPTAKSAAFTEYAEAVSYIKEKNNFPIVIKADGLAAGKGVTVAADFDSAESALKDALVNQKFKDAGKLVVIEDFLKGEEASILAFIDGKTIVPMVAAQDHKAVFDGDTGPNTGGMGAYSPAKIVTPKVLQRVHEQVLAPLLAGLAKENIAYKGIVYAGLMIDNEVPQVIEFNVRFGDPETQVVVPRLKTDLIDILNAIVTQTLIQQPIEWRDDAAVCVVLAAKGYPGDIESGKPIDGDISRTSDPDVHVIQAGTTLQDGQLITKGGRVLGVVGTDHSLATAIQKTYAAISEIHFEGMHFRRDIGKKGI